MAPTLNIFRNVQLLSIVGSAYVAGNIAGVSLIGNPAVLRATKTSGDAARHHSALFQTAAERHHAPVVASGLAFAYLAWGVRRAGIRTVIKYGMASCVTLGFFPYTWRVMEPAQKFLLSKVAEAEREEKVDDQEINELVEDLAVLNTVASMFPLMGAMLCLSVALGL